MQTNRDHKFHLNPYLQLSHSWDLLGPSCLIAGPGTSLYETGQALHSNISGHVAQSSHLGVTRAQHCTSGASSRLFLPFQTLFGLRLLSCGLSPQLLMGALLSERPLRAPRCPPPLFTVLLGLCASWRHLLPRASSSHLHLRCPRHL